MLLRSSSAPFLSALVSEGINECSSFSKPFAASSHFIPSLHSRAFSSLPMSSMRRAHSDTDLDALFHSLAQQEHHQIDAVEQKHHHSCSKPSIIQAKGQLGSAFSEAKKRCLGKEELSINERPCSGEGCRHLPASVSRRISAPRVCGIAAVKDGERASPLIGSGGTCMSSKAEDTSMNIGGDSYGGRGGSRGWHGQTGSPHGDFDAIDLYYQELLQSDPQNPLFLRNYAQFLSEAKRDYNKCEEYYERAILACPNDGEVLSKYANHVWDVHKDSEKAGSYFEQAVKATPDDCYVLASHASFLWQSEEDVEDANGATQTAFPLLHETCAAPSPLMALA